MNNLKRYLGIIWIALGPAAIFLMLWQAVEKVGAAYGLADHAATDAARSVARSAAGNALLQWAIIILIFIPIAIGLVIFGWYAFKGEYDRLPESSREIS